MIVELIVHIPQQAWDFTTLQDKGRTKVSKFRARV